MTKMEGWEDMPEETRAEAALSYTLGMKLTRSLMKAPNIEVAYNAALNALVNIIINYPEPNKVAEFTASNLVKIVAVNHAKTIDAGTEH